MAVGLIILFVISWFVADTGYGVYSYFSAHRRKLRHLARAERTRAYFGEARNFLMSLARQNKIDVNSATFTMFYQLHTFILRWPDRYKEISDALAETVTTEQYSPLLAQAMSESDEWSVGIGRVAQKTVRGFSLLIFSYSPFLRAIAWIETKSRAISGILKITKGLLIVTANVLMFISKQVDKFRWRAYQESPTERIQKAQKRVKEFYNDRGVSGCDTW